MTFITILLNIFIMAAIIALIIIGAIAGNASAAKNRSLKEKIDLEIEQLRAKVPNRAKPPRLAQDLTNITTLPKPSKEAIEENLTIFD